MTYAVAFAKIRVEIVKKTFEEEKSMYKIYDFIKGIISEHEPNSKDEFEVLDKIFGIFNPNPWETKLGGFNILIL